MSVGRWLTVLMLVLAGTSTTIVAYRSAPLSRPVAVHHLPLTEVDAPNATITVQFENPVIQAQFEPERAERFIERRFRVDVRIEAEGVTTYQEFVGSTGRDDTIRALFTTWSVARGHRDGTYAGLSSPSQGVMFVSGSTAFERIGGHYVAFAHEYGHMLEGAAHSPYPGNLMSKPIGEARLCDCPGDPYGEWVP